MKELVSFGLGLTYTPRYLTNGIPFISSKNISNDYLDLSDINFISLDEFNGCSKSAKPKYGDILFTRVGSNLGHPVVYESTNDICIFVSLGFLRCKDLINNYYLKHWMNSPNFWQQVRKKVGGSSKFNLNTGWLEEFDVPYRDLGEQQKIAFFLNKIDERIRTQNKIIEEYEALRKSILDLLICNSLEQGKSKIGKIIKEYNVKTIADNEYPVLSSTASGIYYQSDYFNKEAASEDTTGYKCVPKGYCTYRSMSDTGRFYFNIQTIADVGIVSPAYPVFQVIEDSTLFFISVINNDKNMLNQILKLKAGGTRFSLPFKKLIQLDIPWPDYQTRHYFQKIIRVFDKRIDLEKSLLGKYLKQKNYLLNNLFI